VLYVDQASSHHVVQAATWVGRTVPLDDTAIGAAIQGRVYPAGYTATRYTIEPDVSSVAAPIFDRISDDQLAKMGLLVVEHTRQISGKLGATLFSHVMLNEMRVS
jgi:DNA-binding IclR family transcriptional regulator